MEKSNPSPDMDADPQETQEWLDALTAVIQRHGPERAHFLLEKLVDEARLSGGNLPYKATTSYINTIPVINDNYFSRSHCLTEKRTTS